MATAELSIFISYRKVDCGAVVRSLAGTLRQAFGPDTVFVDNQTIRSGDQWPGGIETALAKAAIVLVAIGPSWLKVADEWGVRRLDQKSDWVRREIEIAVQKDKRIIPLLFQGADLPSERGLPKTLAPLLLHQCYHVRDDYWEQDVSALVNRLSEFGCRRTTAKVDYPNPHAFPERLSDSSLESAISSLDGWDLVESVIPGQEPKTRLELMKIYKFRGFRKTIEFMNKSIPFISELNHHPRWENVFNSLTVYLTSWDIGFFPSELDIKLARYFDELYCNFEK